MPTGLAVPVLVIALGCAFFTVIVYAMMTYASVVELWGVNNMPKLKHYVMAFIVRFEKEGIRWTGAAWDNFWTTITIAVLAAPLTAAVARATYVGVRMEYALTGAFGQVFAVQDDEADPLEPGADVNMSFAAKGPVLLRN